MTKTPKPRTRTPFRLVFLGALALAALPGRSALAQTAEERARIDYEAAKIALEQKRPDVALEKLEKVIGTLGKLPDLLYLSAEAAYQAKKIPRAKELSSEAFAAADAAFRKTPEYKALIALSAKIDLEGPTLEAEARGYWVDPSTKLMWTVKDNGSGISGNDAIRWCDNLVLAGYSDWRQPSIDELAGIYDPSITEKDKPKIKAPIRLSSGGWAVWSGTRGSTRSEPSAWGLGFHDGGRGEIHLSRVYEAYRALCVRRSGD